MPSSGLTSISPTVRISYESLQKYLEGFVVDPNRISLVHPEKLPVEARVAEFRLTSELDKRYLITFIFDKDRHNRLQSLTNPMVEDVLQHFQTTGLVDRNTAVILVGKEGSKSRTVLMPIFNSFQIRKLVITDFDGKTRLVDFIRGVVGDIDRIESRNQTLQDPARLDLTSLPIAEKRIRIVDDETKQKVVFANQLIQIPGITEKVALGIADHFQVPAKLMTDIREARSFEQVSLPTGKGEIKRLNVRLRSSLAKVFSSIADPNETVK